LQSQFNLGNAFRKGNFVKQDYTKAAFWYEKSAKAGYSFSQNEYGLLFAQGLGVEQDYYKAYAWISVSAETEMIRQLKI
jgi:TPR repeat protein